MKKIAIVVIIVIVSVLAVSSFNNNENLDQEVDTQQNVVTTENTNTENITEENTVADSGKGIYAEYSGNLEQYEGKDVVLFFKASWCPSCRVLDSDIKQSLNDMPENVVILELDYDNETELKKKYGVTTQHTLVQVDGSGEIIKKWSGGNRLENVLNQIN
jgi:thiol-disulfide isomerase/thioredoxin